ncbi:serrate RNA effector molecule homolog isoform X6 [Dermacentor andersoni]|uniref:serrate RNA effector molecule homolog isoform X6 n=1 Tax=Dermacentor andersoni TaxID=34620 RepID=UPI002155ABAA|nr:serrate RNA effector molecule homolog isoform X6 [Dermacentor andersoni]
MVTTGSRRRRSMGDSDDEYDRRRGRDKFRRERSDYQERRDDRSRGRDDWPERRRDYRDYDVRRSRSDRYSPARHDMSPPVKRMRRDWEPEAGLTQPPMMTFKQFLGSQDDGIDDQEAVRKYNEYKMDFRRQQLNEFFVNHKEEEWFKSKYHPEECGKRKTEQVNALKRRLDAFLKLHEGGWVDAISIDVEKSDRIVRFLDAVVILLEGGTEYDLQALDEPIQEDKPSEGASFSSARDEKEASDKPEVKEESSQGGDAPSSPTRSDVTADDDKRHKRADDEEEDEDAKSDSKQSGGGRKRSYSSSSQSSSSSDSDSDDSDKDASDDQDSGVPGEESGGESKKASRKSKKKSKRLSSSPQAKKATKAKEERSEDGNEEGSSTKGEPEDDDEDGRPDSVTDIKGKGDEEEDESKATVDEQAKKGETGQGDGPKAVESEEKNRPRPLHRTCSIFLRNLAPTITKMEVEAMCKRYPGFLRVAIADPQPERRFFRRGWVTFERTVNIKEICWNLNNIRLRDCELGAIVNRDLSRRIRSVNGIASHKQVIRSDIKLAARIVHNLDNQRSLWIQTEAGTEPAGNAAATDQLPPIEGFGVSSKNPLLKNITDYLIEEASAEEEELLGGSADREENADAEDPSAPGGTNSEKDEMLIKVLDRLLVYLRVVHSVDYYNHSEYASEDEMPNRCGIMHARGSPPSGKVTPQEVADYISHFEGKISPFLQPSTKLSDEEANRLGKKDPEAEVEKFVVANTQELSKDKWLCPLSGKKFKGPEFVRKHIFNKHAEKVEEVRKEVEYFNNYLLDPKRPQLPEHPANRGGPGGGGRGGGGVGHEGPGMMGPFHGGFPPPPPFGFPRGHPGGFPGFGGRNFPDMYRAGFKRNNYGRGLRGEPRALINYRDLDAPNDVEHL